MTSPAARAWLAKALNAAPGAITLEAMAGATSSSVFAVGTTAGRSAVLRLFDNAAWLADEPDLMAHEAAALETAAEAGLPAPRLIAFTDGDVGFGAPALLMTRLPGRVELMPADWTAWIEQLAGALARIHRQPAIGLGWSYFPWIDVSRASVPAWSSNPGAWQRALDIVRGPAPDAPTVFIHRDYHPVNVLWQDGAISGIVDWVNACRGPASVDVAHCRGNLAFMYGAPFADAFLEAYTRASPGFVHAAYWDLMSLLDASQSAMQPYRPWAEFGLEGLTEALMEARAKAYLTHLLQPS